MPRQRRDTRYASADRNLARAGLFWFRTHASTPSSTTGRQYAVSSTDSPCSTEVLLPHTTQTRAAVSLSFWGNRSVTTITYYQRQPIRSYTRIILYHLFVVVFDVRCVLLYYFFADRLVIAHYLLPLTLVYKIFVLQNIIINCLYILDRKQMFYICITALG